MNKSISLALFFIGVRLALAGTLILKRAWVEEFKNRATIDVTFTVDHAHKQPNSPDEDGDMHVSGRAPKEVGLPMVAEVVNARAADEKGALDLIHANEGKETPVAMSGAWRLWFEHPGDMQVQFDKVPPAANTNPDHSFEIHPISKFGTVDLTQSFHEIAGFKPKVAKDAFGIYNKQQISIRATPTAVTLDANKVGFNYVGFRMRLIGKPKKLKDGGSVVLADVEDPQGSDDESLATGIRMIFVKDTQPWKLIQARDDGDEFDVVGIPRVDLNQLSAFIKDAGTGAVKRKLPYELIIVSAKEK